MTAQRKNRSNQILFPGDAVTLHAKLENQYSVYNHRKWLFSDPLRTVYTFENREDREIAGFIAAVCAYGRVTQILSALEDLLDRTGPLHQFVFSTSHRQKERILFSWKHRFASGSAMARLLSGIAGLLEEFGSLESAFAEGIRKSDLSVYPALCGFYAKLSGASGLVNNHLLPDPEKKSACKRYHLFLRWMVRKDDIDPGIWRAVSPSTLLVPLDVHMHRVCRKLGFTRRKQADLAAVFEVTEAFKKINPYDPVKYDFALTRSGILENNEGCSVPGR